ncbi:MAG: hypothetical protein RBR54_04975 [Sulfurimonas sp.]|jgi:hypothetical protein|nr:hypothetical protein [Sulfurimonas sp.]
MNTNLEDIDTEADVEPVNEKSIEHVKSSRKAFSKLALELTDDELKSTGVQKMLLAEISRLESSEAKSESFRTKFHEADKDKAVLMEKEKTFIFSEILYSVSLTLGALLIGLVPSMTSNKLEIGVIGSLFVVGAIVAKVVKK